MNGVRVFVRYWKAGLEKYNLAFLDIGSSHVEGVVGTRVGSLGEQERCCLW